MSWFIRIFRTIPPRNGTAGNHKKTFGHSSMMQLERFAAGSPYWTIAGKQNFDLDATLIESES